MRYPRTFIAAVLSLFLLLSCSTVSAQEKKLSPKQLPAAVAAAFHKTYPAAKIKGASSEVENGKSLYEVESIDGKLYRDLLYTEDGICVEIEETIPAKSVPEEVMASFKKELPKGKIQKAEKVTKGETIQYEIAAVSGKERHEVVIDSAGKVVHDKVHKSKATKGEKEEKED